MTAVVLAGGLGRRLGGSDKPAITIGGRTLVGTVVGAALEAGATRVIVVGPARPRLLAELAEAGLATAEHDVEFTREQQPGGGPVPALAAGLDLATEPWLLLLAADLPFLTAARLRDLLDAAHAHGTGAVLADDQGEPQWLTSCWRTGVLRTALAGYAGTSLRGLLAPLRYADIGVTPVQGEPPYWLDCDTPHDVALATQWLEDHATQGPAD